MPRITYNGYEFPDVYGVYNFTKTPTNLSISFRFLLKESSSSSLMREEKRMLEATKLRRAKATVDFGGADEFTLLHTSNGFNATCTIDKITNENLATETSRPFNCLLELELPYEQDGGRIKASWVAEYDIVDRCTLSFNVFYSASMELSSLEVAQRDTIKWVTEIMKAFFPDIVFERVSELFDNDQNLKRSSYTSIYREVFYESADPSTNIMFNDVNASFQIETSNTRPCMVTGNQASMQTIHVNVSITAKILNASIDAVDKYFSVYRSQLLSDIDVILKPSYVDTIGLKVIQQSNHSYNPATGNFNAFMRLLLLTTSESYITINEHIETSKDFGRKYKKLWDGKPNTWHISHTGSTGTLTRILSFSYEPTKAKPTPVFPSKFMIENQSEEWIQLDTSEKTSIVLWGTGKVPITIKTVIERYLLMDTSQSINTFIETI